MLTSGKPMEACRQVGTHACLLISDSSLELIGCPTPEIIYEIKDNPENLTPGFCMITVTLRFSKHNATSHVEITIAATIMI